MAKTIKAADLIGKVIMLGATGAKYVAKSIDGDKLMCDFINAKGETIPMGVSVKQAQEFINSGKWTISDTDSATVINGVVIALHHNEYVEDAAEEPTMETVEEVEPTAAATQVSGSKFQVSGKAVETKIVVAGVPKPTPKAKTPETRNLNAEGGASDKRERSGKPETKAKPEPKYVYSTYDVKKVDKKTKNEYTVTRAKISGMATDDAAYVNAVSLHASASYEVVDGKKVYILAFSHRYAAAAKDVCEALNAGKSLEDCQAIIAKATEERAVKIENYKAKREERKAKAQTSDVSPQTSKVYTEAEVGALLKRMVANDAEAIKTASELMAKAA